MLIENVPSKKSITKYLKLVYRQILFLINQIFVGCMWLKIKSHNYIQIHLKNSYDII